MEEDQEYDGAGDPAQAFEALRAEVAALRQAMTRTGRELMNEVAQKYDRARQDAERERHHLEEMIGTLERKQEQRLLLGIPAVGFLYTVDCSIFNQRTAVRVERMGGINRDGGSVAQRFVSVPPSPQRAPRARQGPGQRPGAQRAQVSTFQHGEHKRAQRITQ